MTSSGNGRLQIRLFGMFEALLGGVPLEGLHAHPRSQQLLALLCLHPNRDVSTEWAAAQIWPITASVASLRHEVPALRAELGGAADRVVANRGSLCLKLAGAEVDTVALDTAWDRRETDAGALRHAAGQVRGPLLQGWYDEWITPFRATYQRSYIKALRWLAAHAIACSELEEAREHLHLLVECGDPATGLHLKLMVAYSDARNYVEAAQLYEEHRDYLREVHHLLPSDEMTALYRAIPRIPVFAIQFPADHLSREPHAGAVTLDSACYITRASDALFHAAIARQEAIVLLRGPRQGGKTSLLARGLEQARQSGACVVVTDFEKLGAQETETHDALFLALAHRIRKAFELETLPEDVWDPNLGPNANFEGYLRDELLAKTTGHVVWAIDEADHIFGRPYCDSVFGLFRSWYNERALEPSGPWRHFTLILTYSTEAHLYIADLHQSPFNVGTRVVLDDFTPEQVAELNKRYEQPLSDSRDLDRLYALVGGHPFLIRRCLQEARENELDIAALEPAAVRDGGLFADHLTRLTEAVSRDPVLVAGVRGLLEGRQDLSQDSFARLRAAGVVAGESADQARIRCSLYAAYLQRRLP